MERKILLILLTLLVVSAKKIKSKTFVCNEKFSSYTNRECTISDVTAHDHEITMSTKNTTIPISSLTILNSTINDILAISATNLKLRKLNCVGCGLRDMSNQSFSLMDTSTLHWVNISYGSFEKLEKNFFSQLTVIAELDMSHGAITDIDDTAFYDLRILHYLDLSYNNITKLTPKMFTTLKSLHRLFLSHNHIECLEEGLFIKNTELLSVEFSHNDIKAIDGKLFASTIWFQIIDLNHNQLKRLSIGSRELYLNANNNDIENVVCDPTSNIKFIIERLHLLNNSLTDLGCIGSLTKLEILNLNNNKFVKLNRSSFSALTNLQSLSLKSSNIKELEDGVFSQQHSLKTLDISYNNLGYIDLKILSAAKNLEELYIGGNNITEFSFMHLKKTFSKLRTLGIEDNLFNCTFLAQAVKQLRNDNVELVISQVNKGKNSHHINGIGCRDKMESYTTTSKINVELTNKNNFFSKDLLIIFNTVSIIGFIVYKGYKIVKKNFLRIERHHSVDTLHTNIEMDTNSAR